MAAFGTAFGAQASQQRDHNPNKDLEVTSPPDDSISSMCFSPTANLLVATSWDNQVRCWEIAANGTSQPKAAHSHEQPVLCSTWNADGTSVFSGGCDKSVKMWNLATNQQQVVAQHEAPIRHLFYVKEMGGGMLITGGWDKTIRYWDLRSPTPAHTQQLAERVYAMDVRHPMLVVGTADRKMTIFNLSNPSQPYKTEPSPLKFQTRCVTCFPDSQGYLVGSIEGRVAVQHLEEAQLSKNFTFKCHRDGNDIYAVNAITFHPQYGTFVTSGSDGAYNFWDKDSKQRLKAMLKSTLPITAGAYNKDGTIFAYSLSYDWSRGFQDYKPATMRNNIMLHSPQELEVKNRSRPARTGR